MSDQNLKGFRQIYQETGNLSSGGLLATPASMLAIWLTP